MTYVVLLKEPDGPLVDDAVPRLAEHERSVFTAEHARQCHPRGGSILEDYRKLLAQKGRRYMLLLLDTRRPPDAFGRAVQRVDFGGPDTSLLSTARCAAILWEIS